MRTSPAQWPWAVGLTGLVALGFLGTGCVYGDLKQVLRTQVAAETDCDYVTIQKVHEYTGAPPGQYKTLGCGETRIYQCPPADELFSYDDEICELTSERETGAPPPMPSASPSPAGGSDDSMSLDDDDDEEMDDAELDSGDDADVFEDDEL